MKYLALVAPLVLVVIVSGCTQQPTTLSWCIAGETWSGDPGNSTEIIGVTTYEGQLRCHITLAASSEIAMNLYALDEEGNDIWISVVHPELGVLTAHIFNNQCIEGECAYFVATTSSTPA